MHEYLALSLWLFIRVSEKKVKKSKFTISDGLSHKSVVSEQQNNEGQQDSVQADGETSNQVTVVSKYNV